MADTKRKIGVAFSGGGIRSAAFASGVLRRLLQKSVSFDILSCVSGGGYCGASYLEWKFCHNGEDDPKWHAEFFEHMRKRCGIICDWTNPLRGICDTVILICLLFFVVVLVPILNVASPSLPVAFIVDYFAGETLREGFVCPDPETKSFNTSTELQNIPGMLFSFLALATVFFYILSELLDPRGFLHNKARFLFFACLISFAFSFTPWLIEEYISVIPRKGTIGLLCLGIFLWIAIPFLSMTSLGVFENECFSFLFMCRL